MSTETVHDVAEALGCTQEQAAEVIEAAERIRVAIEQRLFERNLLRDTAAFLAARSEWKELGCPEDHPYARLCAEVAASASGPAVGVRDGDSYRVVEL